MASSNIILADRNRADQATLAGGRWSATLPLSNLQNSDQEETARTKGLAVSDSQFTATQIKNLPLRLFALTNHNMSQSATIQIIGRDAQNAIIYDTGIVKVWASIIPMRENNFSEPNFLFGRLLPEDVEGYRINFFHLADNTQKAIKWEYFITDTDNYKVVLTANDISVSSIDNSFNTVGAVDFTQIAVDQSFTVLGGANAGDYIVQTVTANKITVSNNLIEESAGNSISLKSGYIEIGRLWMSPINQFSRNYSYGKATKIQDYSKANADDTGRMRYDVQERTRIFKGNIRGLSKSEKRIIEEMHRRVGISGEVFVIPNPDDQANQQFETFLGSFISLSPITQEAHDFYTVGLDIEEII